MSAPFGISMVSVKLLDNFSNLTCTYGSTTLTDSETKTFLHRNRIDKFYIKRYVIARHNHFYTCRSSNFTGYVSSTEIELRTVLVEEWCVTTTFIFA